MEENDQHQISFVWKKQYKNLFTEVNISSIILFRIAFGFIMLVEVYRYFENGWISRYWIHPKYNFPYYPFNFLEPLPGNGMYYLFIFIGILSFFILLGFLYRLSTILFFLSFTYTFLLEQTRYLNHFYLIILLSFVLIFIPAHKNFSIDAKLFKHIKSTTIPLWCLWLLRFMVGLPLFFGGIAKITPDWLQGQPLAIWLSNDTDFPIIGQFFTEHWMILLMSYSGLFLDLLIIPLLLIKRTRVFAFLAGFLFHLMNAKLFTIGIFPWFMMAATTIFFAPNWVEKVVHALTTIKFKKKEIVVSSSFNIKTLSTKQRITLVAVGFWGLLMMIIPLRHFFIDGNVHWNESGHKYSWHMKLRTKRAKGVLIVKTKEGNYLETISPKKRLPRWQRKKVLVRPSILWSFVHKIKDEYAKKGIKVAIYADVKATLNGRLYQRFINPKVDITSVPYPLFKPNWVLPLTTDLAKNQ